MKRSDTGKTHAGFSLIELLVVIGILGILLAALLPFLGGSRDSALTAKCKNNMQNLAKAALSWAEANDYGHFPAAGFYRSVDVGTKPTRYHPQRSWISNKGPVVQLNSSQRSVYLGEVAHFTDQGDEACTAVTNGAIWFAAGQSFEIYRCPVHAREFEKKNDGRQPWWSFMMNQEFGYNRDGGQKAIPFFGSSFNSTVTVATDESGRRKKKASRALDKVLMFAEVQGIEVDDSKHGIKLDPVTGSDETDAVLEYTEENIGFNHPVGKRRWGGNVAFADGHVDTIIMPTDQSYIKKLTRYLCQGFDVPHDGSTTYTPSSVDE